jgi:hypothetical protein
MRVILDAIRTDWPGFETGLFSISANMASEEPARSYWENLFRGVQDAISAFDNAPIIQIELSGARDTTLPRSLINPRRPWLEVETEAADGFDAILYSPGEKGLFDDPVNDTVARDVRMSESGLALSRIFDMGSWPRSSAAEISSVLGSLPAFSQSISFDVGQGSAIALADTTGKPRLYFDVGAGVGRHSSTTPTHLSFCVCDPKAVILSHWDTDHWAGARADPRLLSKVWIVPFQRIGPSHAKLANDILIAGGSVKVYASKKSISVPLFWGKPRWALPSRWPNQLLTLFPCTGNSRNDSGFALRILDIDRGLQWLLTGDASYDVIPSPIPTQQVDYAVITASHHGARQPRAASVIPSRSGHRRYARLLYSFALPNHYGHPHAESVTTSALQGWAHAPMTTPYDTKDQDVLATGLGDLAQPRASVVGGWRRRPLVAQHLLGCVAGYRFVR